MSTTSMYRVGSEDDVGITELTWALHLRVDGNPRTWRVHTNIQKHKTTCVLNVHMMCQFMIGMLAAVMQKQFDEKTHIRTDDMQEATTQPNVHVVSDCGFCLQKNAPTHTHTHCTHVHTREGVDRSLSPPSLAPNVYALPYSSPVADGCTVRTITLVPARTSTESGVAADESSSVVDRVNCDARACTARACMSVDTVYARGFWNEILLLSMM